MRKTVLGDRLYRGVTEEGSGSLKNQVRAREGRLQSLMEELEGKKGEIVDLNTQLEEAKQQVVLQQERQNQFVTTESGCSSSIFTVMGSLNRSQGGQNGGETRAERSRATGGG